MSNTSIFNEEVDKVYGDMFLGGNSIYDTPITKQIFDVTQKNDEDFDKSIPVNKNLFTDQAAKNVKKLFE